MVVARGHITYLNCFGRLICYSGPASLAGSHLRWESLNPLEEILIHPVRLELLLISPIFIDRKLSRRQQKRRSYKCLVFGLARLWAHDIIEEMHSGYQMHWYSRRLRENMLLERKGHFSSFDFKKENLLFFGCKWFVPKNLELFPSAWKNSTNTLVIGL